MPKELIFTSAPNGVDPGSSGYCTVAKHKGIDRLLTKALEGISYYEMMNDPEKPVVRTYRILRLKTGIFCVLSRIGYSGSDHTGRTNYIAHHLVFEHSEVYALAVTPAEILLYGKGWLEEWPQGTPASYLQEGQTQITLPSRESSLQSGSTWQKVAGSPELAHELGLKFPWKFVGKGSEQETSLSLVAEFGALQASGYNQKAWELTFSTFLQPSDKASDFQLVGGLENGPISGLSRNSLKVSQPFDPTQCFKPAQGNAYGSLPKTAVTQETQAANLAEKSSSEQTVQSESHTAAPSPQTTSRQDAVVSPSQSNLSGFDLGESGSSSLPTDFGKGMPVKTPMPQRPKKSVWPKLILVCGLCVLLSATAIVFYILQSPNDEETQRSGDMELVQTENAQNEQEEPPTSSETSEEKIIPEGNTTIADPSTGEGDSDAAASADLQPVPPETPPMETPKPEKKDIPPEYSLPPEVLDKIGDNELTIILFSEENSEENQPKEDFWDWTGVKFEQVDDKASQFLFCLNQEGLTGNCRLYLSKKYVGQTVLLLNEKLREFTPDRSIKEKPDEGMIRLYGLISEIIKLLKGTNYLKQLDGTNNHPLKHDYPFFESENFEEMERGFQKTFISDSAKQACRKFKEHYDKQLQRFDRDKELVSGFGEIRKNMNSYAERVEDHKFKEYVKPPFEKDLPISKKKEILGQLLQKELKGLIKGFKYFMIDENNLIEVSGRENDLSIKGSTEDFYDLYFSFNEEKKAREISQINNIKDQKNRDKKINALSKETNGEKNRAKHFKSSLVDQFKEYKYNFQEFDEQRKSLNTTALVDYKFSKADRTSTSFEEKLLEKIESERVACEQVATIFSKIMDESESRSSESKGGRKYLDPETREVVLIVGD